jgi:uncharacterized protein YlxW (UPF0749 family)
MHISISVEQLEVLVLGDRPEMASAMKTEGVRTRFQRHASYAATVGTDALGVPADHLRLSEALAADPDVELLV